MAPFSVVAMNVLPGGPECEYPMQMHKNPPQLETLDQLGYGLRHSREFGGGQCRLQLSPYTRFTSFKPYISTENISMIHNGLVCCEQDVWVFERTLQKSPLSKWRVAGRLGGIPPTPPLRPSLRERLSGLLLGSKEAKTLTPTSKP